MDAPVWEYLEHYNYLFTLKKITLFCGIFLSLTVFYKKNIHQILIKISRNCTSVGTFFLWRPLVLLLEQTQVGIWKGS